MIMKGTSKLFLSFLLASSCDAAGMTAHNVAARRASQYEYFGPTSNDFNPAVFYNLASDRSDAVQAGAPFPDYLYACGDEHDAGEEAHWTPFQIASVNYIREKYPNWSTEDRLEDGPGLVAFTMGVTSHYIADINWHGLEVIPAGEGLIRTMGYSDFNCTGGSLCGEAHTAADTGGEFVAGASLDLSWFPQRNWFVPTEDLVNIYAEMNATGQGPLVEAQWINECAVLFYAGSFGISRFGDLIYPLLAPKLGGVLLEQFFDFPVGGVDDDAAWTSFMWNRLAEWLVYGPPPDDPPPNFRSGDANSAMMKERKASRHKELKAKKMFVSSIRQILRQELNQKQADEEMSPPIFEYNTLPSGAVRVGLADGWTPDQLSTETLEALGEALIKDYLLVLYPELKQTLQPTIAESQSHIQDLEAGHQSKLDHQVSEKLSQRARDIQGDMKQSNSLYRNKDREDLLIGLPLVAEGQEEREYFSSSLNAMSNGRDVLVGSPGAGVPGGPQQGSASLIFDVATEKNPASLVFEGGHGVDAVDSAMPSYERFGWSSTSCDVNRDSVEDLVICAPSYRGGQNTTAAHGDYTGRCDVFYGPFSVSEKDRKEDLLRPNLSLYGDKEWGNFGYSVSSGDMDGDGHCDLVVSAPFSGSYPDISPDEQGDLSSQGAVYVFLSKSLMSVSNETSISRGMRLEASDAADMILQPPGAYQWFGKSLEVVEVEGASADDVSVLLLVGAPVFHSMQDGAERSAVGRVYGFDAAELQNQHIDPLFTVTGCNHAASTGHAVAASSTHFAFSETGWNTTTAVEELRTGKRGDAVLRAGRVTAVEWAPFLSQARSNHGADILVCSLGDQLPAGAIKTFEGNAFEGRYGSALAFDGHGKLLVGAPLADDGRGRVSRVDVTTGVEEVLYSSGRKEKSLGKSRVGQSLAVTGLGNDDNVGSGVLVGGPYATTESGEQTGVVFLF